MLLAELEDFSMKLYESEEELRLLEEEERAKEKEKTLRRPAEERGAIVRRGPRRRELTNYRRTFK